MNTRYYSGSVTDAHQTYNLNTKKLCHRLTIDVTQRTCFLIGQRHSSPPTTSRCHAVVHLKMNAFSFSSNTKPFLSSALLRESYSAAQFYPVYRYHSPGVAACQSMRSQIPGFYFISSQFPAVVTPPAGWNALVMCQPRALTFNGLTFL